MTRPRTAADDLPGMSGSTGRLRRSGHRVQAVRGHLQEMAGTLVEAHESYLAAAQEGTSLPQKRYLHAQATRLELE